MARSAPPSFAVDPPAPPARHWILFAAAAPIVALAVLRAASVPLGKLGTFHYPYSPIAGLRAGPALIGVALSALAAAGVALLGSPRRARRGAGWALALAAWVGLGAWAYRAPPAHYNQHVFNAASPSHDGAFVAEALTIRDLAEYLPAFPQRTRTPVAELRGTRIVSNPPGATLAAVGVRWLLDRAPRLGDAAVARFERAALPAAVDREKLRPAIRLGVAYFWALTAAWAVSAAVYYAVGRLYFAPPAAVALALCSTLAGPTLLFVPGKDAAQLLTAGVPLLLWLAATRPATPSGAAIVLALAAGAGLVAATLASLVHLWLAAVVVAACLAGAARTGGLWRLALRAATPAALGAGAAIAACDAVGLDFFATCVAVAEAQARVTRGPDAMPLAWQALGVPLFVLFAGPAFWLLLAWTRPRTCDKLADVERTAVSTGLLLGSATVLVATVGFTNIETPRLWIPFVPLLLLGAMLRLPTLRTAPHAAALFLAQATLAQLGVAWLQWALMDMRETETRIVAGRFFG